MTNDQVIAETEYMPATDASVYLRISKTKMAKLLRTGVLPFIPSQIDGRIKMIKRSDVEALARRNLRRYPKTDPQAA